ncbi:FUSC family protein [Parafrankia elaeagni]|uniref:FUSC family protein n=1 Tax=Parafrankia elaeagni TaxID=222534 RepID=UPI001E5A88DD|nr:FUSC family protein [Parafrankia elaeagni]
MAPVVLVGAFALVGNVRMCLFAWFGVIALLEFVDFEGTGRERLRAYLTLTASGALLIVLGTLCSRTLALAAVASAVVAFVVMFAGVLNPYVAVAGRSALLAFVLSVMTPGPLAAIPERLAGWGLGAAGSIVAVLVLWPRRPPDRLRANIAAASRALAAGVTWPPAAGRERTAGREPAAGQEHTDTDTDMNTDADETARVWAELLRLRREFAATAHRPTGLGGRAAALGYIFIDLNWLLPFALPWPERDRTARACFPAEAAEIHEAVAATLHAVATRIEPSRYHHHGLRRSSQGGPRPGDAHQADDRLGMARLERSERAMRAALLRYLRSQDAPASPRRAPGTDQPGELGASAAAEVPGHSPPALAAAEAFRLRRLARGTRDLALNVLKATAPSRRPGRMPGSLPATELTRLRSWVRERGSVATDLAVGYASTRSVWFRNSVRKALGIALAVVIAQLVGVDQAFWVVLGTLSVLRTNAMATASAALRALAGTVIGIAAGGLVVIVAGDTTAGLWALLPLAVFLGSYARRLGAFALGQAGFTATVILLFNIVEPAGWRIGIVRIEDVIIGFAVSIAAGALLWPRGAVAVLRARARAAYLSAVHSLVLAASTLPHEQQQPGRTPDEAARAARGAVRAGRLLDDAVRHFLVEDPPERFDIDALMMIVAGAQRIRRTAQLLRQGDVPWPADLPEIDRSTEFGAAFPAARAALSQDVEGLCFWYRRFADALGVAGRPPAPDLTPGGGGPAGLALLRSIDAGGIDAGGIDAGGNDAGGNDAEIGATRSGSTRPGTGPRPETVAGIALAARAAYIDILRGIEPMMTAAALALERPAGDDVDGLWSSGGPGPTGGQAPEPQQSRPAPVRSSAFIRAS